MCKRCTIARSIIKNRNRKKNSQYKLFWIGNETRIGGVGIFVADKLTEKVLEVKRFSDRLIIIKLQMDKKTDVVVSAYAPQEGLTNDKKTIFMKVLQN